MVGVWDATRESAVAQAFAATSAPYAADVWARVEPRLDAYARAWTDAWSANCEARTSGVDTTMFAELPIACLERRKGQFDALVDVFAAADASVIERAVQAAAALPSIAECESADTLLAPTPAPTTHGPPRASRN